MADAGINIAGKKVSYKVIAIGAGGAVAIFLLTRGSGNGGTQGVPIFPQGQQSPGGDNSWDSIEKQLSDLYKNYTDLLARGDNNANKIIDYSPIQYQIQPGDTPQSIAAKFGLKRADIKHFNSWLDWAKWQNYIGKWIYVPHSPQSA